MTDIAKLSIEIDTSSVPPAKKALEGLGTTIRQVEKDERNTKTATDELNNAFKKLPGNTGAAGAATNALNRDMASLGSVARQLKAALAFLVGGTIVNSLMNVAMGYQRAMMTLSFVTGSMDKAKVVFNDVMVMADRIGLSFEQVLPSFNSFAAAASQTGLSLESIKTTFEGVSAAMVAMGRNEFDAQRALMALQQMLSKGKVQAEELTQQFAEAMPGGVALAAAAFGYGQDRLRTFVELISDGKISAKDFVETVGSYLQQKFASSFQEVDTASKRMGELENAFYRLKLEVVQSGFMDALMETLRSLTQALQDADVQKLAKDLGQVLPGAARALVDILMVLVENLDILQALLVGWVAGKFLLFLDNAAYGLIMFGKQLAAGLTALVAWNPVLGTITLLVGGLTAVITALTLAEDGATRALREWREQQDEFLETIPDMRQASADMVADKRLEAYAVLNLMKAELALVQMRMESAKALSGLLGIVGDAMVQKYAEHEAMVNDMIARQRVAISELDSLLSPNNPNNVVENAIPPTPVLGGGPGETDDAALKRFQKEVEKVQQTVNGLFNDLERAKGAELAAALSLEAGNRAALDSFNDLADAQAIVRGFEGDARLMQVAYEALVAEGITPASASATDLAIALAEVNRQTREAEEAAADYEKKLEDMQPDLSWLDAFNAAVDDYVKNVKDSGESVKEVFSDVFDRATDSLVDFLMTGKLETGDFLQYIARELMKFVVQTIIMAPLLEYFKNLMNSVTGGGSGGGGIFGSILGGIGGLLGFQKGGVFDQGNQVKRFASGGIVDALTTFPMADGSTGMMGEAGPEGVFPLTRLPGGDLGVRGVGGGGGNIINIVSNITLNRSGKGNKEDDKKDAEDLARMIERRVEKKIDERLLHHSRPGNLLNRTSYGQR